MFLFLLLLLCLYYYFIQLSLESGCLFNFPTYLYDLPYVLNICHFKTWKYFLYEWTFEICINPSVLSPLDLLFSLSKIPSVTRFLQSSSFTSRAKTAWMCRQWRRDHPPHHPSPICWSGCRMRSVTTGSSILSRHFLTWVMVSAHCSEGQLLNSRVHVCEEENFAADAPAGWSRTLRVCAQKMEEPGVTKCGGQDHRWCWTYIFTSVEYVDLNVNLNLSWSFYFQMYFAKSLFSSSPSEANEKGNGKQEMEWERQQHTEKDWLFSWSCCRWISGLWTSHHHLPQESFQTRLKTLHIIMLLHSGGWSKRRTDLFFLRKQARTN